MAGPVTRDSKSVLFPPGSIFGNAAAAPVDDDDDGFFRIQKRDIKSNLCVLFFLFYTTNLLKPLKYMQFD